MGSLKRRIIRDTTPPTAPTGLTATPFSASRVDLAWSAAFDVNGIARYDIYRNGSFVNFVSGLTLAFSDTSVAQATTYSYTVRARDAANNLGPPSGSATATTPATNTEPTWTDAVPATITLTVGQPFSYTLTAYDPDVGDSISIIEILDDGEIATVNAQSGRNRTVTLASAGLAAGTYTVTLDLDDVPNAEADWNRRLAACGSDLMWSQSFASDNEIYRFVDPTQENASNITRVSSGGPGNFPYMRIRVPPSQGSAANTWRRPFAALPADAWGPADPGYTDPVAGGADPWTNRTSSASYRRKMVYGHPDYWPGPTSQYPTAGSKYAEWLAMGPSISADPDWFVGHDFWISVAFRTTSATWQFNENGGKFHWFTIFNKTIGGTEAVFYPRSESGGWWAYQAPGSSIVDLLSQPQAGIGALDTRAYGSEWETTCLNTRGWYSNVSTYVDACWHLPSWPGNVGDFGPYTAPIGVADESTWTHFLYYWKLGYRGTSTADTGSKNTHLKIWINNAATGTWRPIFRFEDRIKVFDSDLNLPWGFSYFMATCYFNGRIPNVDGAGLEWGNDYAQIIFKRGNGNSANPETDGIPCPQVV